jgi:hypothetical protein
MVVKFVDILHFTINDFKLGMYPDDDTVMPKRVGVK